MATGHIAVVRRSLSLPEWTRIRLREIARWERVCSRSTGGWEIREAEYTDPSNYRFLHPWRKIRPGDTWGGPDGTFFFRAKVKVAAEFKGLPVSFHLVTTAEMIVRVNGRIFNAFDPNRSDIPLVKRAEGGEVFEIEMEAYVRSAPDDQRIGQGGSGYGCVHQWREPELVSYDAEYRALMNDIGVPVDVAGATRVAQEVKDYLWPRIDEAVGLLDRETNDRREFHRSARAAREHLKKHVYGAPNLAGRGAVALVAHSHLDVAYHWRVRQGIRKNARTTAVQLALMEQYPDMLYSHTQPYLYETLKIHYPELFARVKRMVVKGRWELIGGMYVEPDCLVPSGESLIRQCLLGQLFYQEEFGAVVDTCWLPDVFGNSWIMPQILRRSGIRHFVSNKMSTWNDTNRFPHNNFIWRGVDGSEVHACVPASHFITWLAADQIQENWDGFQEKNEVGESLNMFGFGDGGGGVTAEMMEISRRIADFPGLPRTRVITGKQYLDEALARSHKLETWDGELYLEMHRGTATTKGSLKRLNRRCEMMAREAEIFSVLAGIRPGTEWTEAWKKTLVNQFHDILPGSHVEPVARDAEATYGEALATFGALRDKALKKLAARVATNGAEGKPLVVFNSLNWPHTGCVEVNGDGASVTDADGNPVPCQRTSNGRLLFLADAVPPVGHAVFFVRPGKPSAPPASDPLENRFFRVRLNDSGELTSVWDKRANREVLAGPANVPQVFEDKPGIYDAWDILASYEDHPYPMPAEAVVTVEENGPVRAVLRVERAFLSSKWEQRIILYRDIPRIDFVTRVDWREQNKLLKVAFPVAVLAREATYDLSYGTIQRPTHANTTWDKAKYEVCGHQWADLSESGYGVSVLNDCKYGWDIRRHTMRLSLLRGSIRPDPVSDLGTHEFTYSLHPHVGDWREGGTVEAAMELNNPLVSVATGWSKGAVPARHSWFALDGKGVFLGALKPAERGRGTVVRLAELYGGRKSATLRWDGLSAGASECDFIERPEQDFKPAGDTLAVEMLPYQIRTFRTHA